MKVGDLVTVLPARASIYLVVEYIGPDPLQPIGENPGTLWALYNEERGIGKMHAKWVEVISESR